MSAPDLQAIRAHALAAAKRASRWVYRTNYAIRAQTISRREPDDHSIHLTGLHTWDYAEEADCTIGTARAHLRKLVTAGLLTELKRFGGASKFLVPREDAIAIGREIIAELQAEGLPFDDDWRAAREVQAK